MSIHRVVVRESVCSGLRMQQLRGAGRRRPDARCGLSTLPNASAVAVGVIGLCLPISAPAQAQGGQITYELSRCSASSGPAIKVTLSGVRSAEGVIRVQSYRGTASDWLQKGRWINRIEAPAKDGTMTFCLPVPEPGTYAVAVRHDVNGNGATDLLRDGGGISNNPAINVFNLGKPSYKKAAILVGRGVTPVRIDMKYR